MLEEIKEATELAEEQVDAPETEVLDALDDSADAAVAWRLPFAFAKRYSVLLSKD